MVGTTWVGNPTGAVYALAARPGPSTHVKVARLAGATREGAWVRAGKCRASPRVSARPPRVERGDPPRGEVTYAIVMTILRGAESSAPQSESYTTLTSPN